ncbi:MAG: hypothetical protein ACKVS8_02095 [Phycisphaerales bacterium]
MDTRSLIRTLLLAGACLPTLTASALAVEPTSIRKQAQEAEELARLFTTLDESDPGMTYSVARKLAAAPDRAGIWALKDAWPDLKKTSTKESILSTFFSFRGPDPDQPRLFMLHPRLVDVLDLGVKDPNAATQSFALRCLKSLALDDFAEDFGKYQAWRTAMAQQTDANDVLAESVRAFVARAKDSPPERCRTIADFLDEHGAMLRDIPAARAAALDAGWADVLGAWLRSDEASMQAAMRLSSGLLVRREDLEKHVIPLLAPDHHAALRGWAAATLGDARAEWAVDAILDAVRESLASTDDLRAILPPVSRALAALGDPRAVPVLIAAIEAEGTSASAQTVGVFALGPLTGVRITTDQTAAWWRTWWEKNRARFPSAAQMDIPAPLRPAGTSPAAPLASNEGMMPPTGAGGDVGPMSPAMQLSASFDNDQRFFLVGTNPAEPGPAPASARAGRKLLIIIPGGDGSPSLKPFAQRLHAQALDDSWLVAQLVAPKWDPGQFDTLVWPTGKSPWNGARFTTEAFADAVVKEVAGRTAIDAKHIYILAWASAGPAGYAALLRPASPFTGGVIAMSDFAIAKVDTLKAAKGKRIALIHAEGDTTTPIRAAEVARDWLARSGATVNLARLQGPRGWPEGTMPLLKEAIAKVGGAVGGRGAGP